MSDHSTMESFGFDFGGGDLLDIGSLGSWGAATSLGSSPSNGGLPFSVGTPTGVQSLGDDHFASLPGGNDDFNFMDSPKAPGATTAVSSTTSSSTTTTTSGPTSSTTSSMATAGSGSTAATTSATTKNEPSGDLSSSYFGAELDGNAGEDKNKIKTEDHKAPTAVSGEMKLKDGPGGGSAGPTSSASSSASSSSSATAAGDNSSMTGFLMGGPSSSKPSLSPARTSQAVATSSAPTTTNSSSARPHIDPTAPSPGGRANQHPQQQQPQPPPTSLQQQQVRYPPNSMMMNQQPGQPGPNFVGQPYGMGAPGGPMGGAPGQPGMPPNAQYMQPQFRPATSTYDEEMMRVKSMMMQHPELIPPPLEVLRISMAQAAVSQTMMPGGAAAGYMQRVGPQGQVMNRIGPAQGYPPYGAPNPNMMMQGQTQSPMVDPRMRAVMTPQQGPQPNQPRTTPQVRTPGGSAGGVNPDAQAAWQSENDLPLRRKMIGKIVSLLQQRKPDAPAEWIRRLPDMARRLEDSLYRTAKNRDEYGDFSSLKTRLQHLAVTMGARAQHKAGGANPRQPGVVPGPGPGMMAAPVPQSMGMNPGAIPAGMAPQAHAMGNMQYANMQGRMTPQQQMQMQQMQMQMQNPQMRQQFTPQQLQQFHAAQMQRRHYQMQHQAQLQRQNSMQAGQQPGQPPSAAQQFVGNQALQRQNSMRQQPGQQPTQASVQQMQQMNQQQQQRQAPNPNYVQQGQQQHNPGAGGNPGQPQGQSQNPQLQRRGSMNGGNPGGRPSSDMSLGQSMGSESDFLNLDLSSSFMGDDLSLDAGLGGDPMKAGDQHSGAKRTLSQSQQQMAAAANAAAFKRSKVGGATNPRGSSPHSPQSSQSMSKPTQGGGSSKTPPISAVNAK